jgi:hypothetical protein
MTDNCTAGTRHAETAAFRTNGRLLQLARNYRHADKSVLYAADPDEESLHPHPLMRFKAPVPERNSGAKSRKWRPRHESSEDTGTD